MLHALVDSSAGFVAEDGDIVLKYEEPHVDLPRIEGRFGLSRTSNYTWSLLVASLLVSIHYSFNNQIRQGHMPGLDGVNVSIPPFLVLDAYVNLLTSQKKPCDRLVAA